jgi:hypothetical protein
VTGEQWAAKYVSYAEDCARWNLEPQSFDEFKAYWELFATDGELLSAAPILVQRA